MPTFYRIACGTGCCLTTALLLVGARLGSDGVAELGLFLLLVAFYYGSQIVRTESLAKCANLHTMLMACVVSFVGYYALELLLLVAPLPIYLAFCVLAPLAFLVNARTPIAPRQSENPHPWKSLVCLPVGLLLLFGIAGGLLSAAGGTDPATTLADIFVKPSPAYLAMALAFICLSICTAFGRRLRRAVFFALMNVLWLVGSMLGMAVLSAVPDVPSIVFMVAAMAVGLAIFATFVVRQDIWIETPAESTENGEEAATDKDSRSARVERLAERGGLTKREAEVLHLLMDGRSVPYIQEKLYISEGTARTHVKHIYAKLGVHSKQELLDLLE